MTTTLDGRSVAFLVANEGVEQDELVHPWNALRALGAHVVLIAPELGFVQAFHHLDRADRFTVDLRTLDATAAAYDAFVLPGGVANPDILRRDKATHRILRAADRAGLPIAAICHGPWTLIDAELVAGRTLAAWPSLATDLVNAGARWTPDRVHVDGTLITAQGLDDVEQFTRRLVESLTRTTSPTSTELAPEP
ncbi:protease I [Nocardia amikacinitolerans]|uniref:type 1 glutamine amidotransferase domain-containing protein n=1 Tax=Nocardia amikacinitolerans TaxID=756689 RepID=UPI0008373238|nr:type 1 glutamine amidotransferase domain-containing protein [Nocardia amikacinitolerans]MCP2317132.1 protease I [Nocardia amikacinitolerans]